MLPFIHLTLPQLIETAGYLGIFAMAFAESGLAFGIIFPGDSLLFTAGLLASQGFFNIALLALGTAAAAIIGDSVGYWFGAKVGPALFTKEDSFFFNKRYIERTEAFYARHGARAVMLARFIPIVRTFAPILAGVGSMRYRTFLTYNIIGGIAWGMGVTFAGYFLGRQFPQSEHYLLPIVLAIIVVSTLPVVFEFWKQRNRS